ncbi:MAG: DUF2116 family Zn-ribbon domain-containing protein [Thermoplasmata archaeon]|nr:DUF2116 family Zn-ribbon domain-containing protein [Thermoplasmata archaeon]
MDDEHRHCKVCGKVCDVDEEVCSTSCATKREERRQSSRNLKWMLYGGMAVILLLFVASFLHA